MSETENREQVPSQNKPGTTSSPRLAVIAIIVALLAAILALVLWIDAGGVRYQTQARVAAVQTRVESLEKNVSEQRAALSAEARERDQMLVGRQESLEQGMQALRDQLSRDHSEWMAAESDYLLRVANRRLMLERDVRGALLALRSADQLLADGANPLYLPVREQLRSEIQSLEAITPIDVDGIALELSGLSRQLDTLPLATVHHDATNTQAQSTQTTEEKGSVVSRFFGTIKDALKGMVTVRRLDQKVLPLIPPEQRYFLTQNLRLRLEMARLALLRGDAAIYHEDLKTASAWLDEYYDREDAMVKHSRETVARLAQINITPALPEISVSQRTLERIRDKLPGRKPASIRGRLP